VALVATLVVATVTWVSLEEYTSGARTPTHADEWRQEGRMTVLDSRMRPTSTVIAYRARVVLEKRLRDNITRQWYGEAHFVTSDAAAHCVGGATA
jgi:hypothetical protein